MRLLENLISDKTTASVIAMVVILLWYEHDT